jgi:hypothetical protein
MSALPPYISAGVGQKFIDLCEYKTFEIITPQILQVNGFSVGNASALMSALRSMQIIDEDGNVIDPGILSRLAYGSERQGALKEIVDRTYPELLRTTAIENASVKSVEKYFRISEKVKASIAGKAARFFIWIAGEAGYEVAERVEATKVVHRPTKPKPTQSISEPEILQEDHSNSRGSSSPKPQRNFRAMSAKAYRDQLILILMDKIENSPDPPDRDLIDKLSELIDVQAREEESEDEYE